MTHCLPGVNPAQNEIPCRRLGVFLVSEAREDQETVAMGGDPMAALKLDLTIEQGSTWAHGFRPMVANVPLLAAGWTAKSQIRSTYAGDVLHEWSTALGNILIDPVLGNLVLTLDADDSTPWTWTKALYDVEVTSPDGATTRRIAQGKVRISPEVTR